MPIREVRRSYTQIPRRSPVRRKIRSIGNTAKAGLHRIDAIVGLVASSTALSSGKRIVPLPCWSFIACPARYAISALASSALLSSRIASRRFSPAYRER